MNRIISLLNACAVSESFEYATGGSSISSSQARNESEVPHQELNRSHNTVVTTIATNSNNRANSLENANVDIPPQAINVETDTAWAVHQRQDIR